MLSPLLETKLYAARVRSRSVARPRLTEHLDLGAGGRLLLVSAPAGFGKTTALAQWVHALDTDRHGTETAGSRGPDVAWLSLDAADNDPRTFCSYLVAALHRATPDIGADQLEQLDQLRTPGSSSSASFTALLAGLLNDVADLAHDVVLVLDDYHVIESPEVHEQLNFIIEHAPPQLHLAVATRVDPPLPLARLRVRGELTEVRAADLRFDTPEADTYFNDVMQLGLTAPQVAALSERAEGWVAALQLAAISLAGRDDVDDIASFISGFAGDDRYIVDYLAEEVLHRQPAELREFLLHTSVLDRLTGSLCDAVTGRDDGRRTLEALERANMFLVPLDGQRRWYRYHHLFADVLRARLLDEQPDRVAGLHLAASRWYADHAQLDAAIRYAFAGEDSTWAADLIERAVEPSRRERTEATMRTWLQKLPRDVVGARPVLAVALAGARLASGETDGVAELLDEADLRLAESADAAHPADAGRTARPTAGTLPSQPGWVELYRSGLAQANRDTSSTLRHARSALDKLDPEDLVGRAAASALLGLASWAGGDLDRAHGAYTAALTNFRTAGFLTDVMGCAVVLANIRKTQGRLQDALATHVDALHFATGQPHPVRAPAGTPADGPGGPLEPGHSPDEAAALTLRGVVDTYVGMADVHRERGDLGEAGRLLHLAESAGDTAGLPQARYRRHVVRAQVEQALGHLDVADALLEAAERLYVDDFHPDVAPVAATRARLWVAQGRLDEALTWARSRDLSLSEDVTFLREYEHLTLVRAHLAGLARRRGDTGRDRAELEAVLAALERALAAADAGGRAGTVLDVLVHQAVALRLTAPDQGPTPAASLRALERALILAEPQGYSRAFLDAGPVVVELLNEANREHISLTYVRDLLHQHTATRSPAAPAPPANPTGATPPDPGLRDSDARTGAGLVVEDLSRRERDVLRLLATELNGPDIARELVVSLNTVRTHTKNIYAKLGVTNRRAAIRRANELNLLGHSRLS